MIFAAIPLIPLIVAGASGLGLAGLGMYFAGDETNVTYEGDVTNEGGDGSTFGGTNPDPDDGGPQPDATGPAVLKYLQYVAPLVALVSIVLVLKKKKKGSI